MGYFASLCRNLQFCRRTGKLPQPTRVAFGIFARRLAKVGFPRRQKPMKLIKTTNGKRSVQMTKAEWQAIGKVAWWIKKAESDRGRMTTENPEPDDFIPSLSNEVNQLIQKSKRDGGLFLKDAPESAVIFVKTKNTTYKIERQSGTGWLISGHPTFCPSPSSVIIHGSTWGGSMLKMNFIGINMHMEFVIDGMSPITTSPIQNITIVEKS
jgi:hypothetical protein